ncbi:MAG: adenylate/guanylate cyclase domain-containing protein, partial [Myxococcota bacterium]
MIWSRLSLLAKVLIVANFLLVTAISAAGVFTYRVAQEAVRNEIIASGQQSVRDFAKVNALDFLDEEKGKLDLQLKLKGLVASDSENRLVGAFIYGGSGEPLAEMSSSGAGPSFALLENLESTAVIESSDEAITIAAPVFYDDLRLGSVAFRFASSRIREAGTQILYQAIAIIAIALIVNFALLIVVLRRVLKPVSQLGDASEAFARGDFRSRIESRTSQDEIGRAAQSFNDMADALELHMRFSNAALVERIQHGGTDDAKEHQLSVVFGDAVGYTSWASLHSPAEIFEMLSRYYTCMGRITVRSFQGIIDKFIGDGIMMHYGMLRDQRRVSAVERAYVRNALRATIYSQFAMKLLTFAVTELEGKRPLTYRFGLASGKCMMGPVGAQHIMLDYSIIGNVVNLASRLEGK